VLDEKSLQLIINDAENDGRNALTILRVHYAITEKTRIITLNETLTTITMTDTEDITVTRLRLAGEIIISDNLMTAMLLKRLPASYNSFAVVHTQSELKKNFERIKS